MISLLILCIILICAHGFRVRSMVSGRRSLEVLRMSDDSDNESTAPVSKGFGKAKTLEKGLGEPVEMSAGDRTYASQAKRGVPEYNVFIRPSNGTDEEWVPVGSMTIPRDTPVGKAIYDVEGELLKGTFKLYPKLKAFSDVRSEKDRKNMWEYGTTLKAFPDEAIEIRRREDGTFEQEGGGNFFNNWIRSITNPVDNSELKNKGVGTLNQNK